MKRKILIMVFFLILGMIFAPAVLCESGLISSRVAAFWFALSSIAMFAFGVFALVIS